jgi:hypothetical protein
LVVLPTAADREAERVLAVARAPEVLDELPLPIVVPFTFTLGLEIACDCELDPLMAVEADPEFDCELWA